MNRASSATLYSGLSICPRSGQAKSATCQKAEGWRMRERGRVCLSEIVSAKHAKNTVVCSSGKYNVYLTEASNAAAKQCENVKCETPLLESRRVRLAMCALQMKIRINRRN